ncbi:MAG: hypothetical protein A3I78_03625 [Gammaproteobacteria bacterium RIFCSPLOWO2_02_FULL_56_15]|nr:MAG: hypothetical protein A3I78_03625 [Gammaproteobacteria bacterium RIFCSPLOWO2_02_FULL_56_15]
MKITRTRRTEVIPGILILALSILLPAGSVSADTVLVTGSNRGIGLNFVTRYAEQGWTVIATHRRDQVPESLAALVGKYPNVKIETVDIGSLESIDALAGRLKGVPIDVLINNAAMLSEGGFDDPEVFNKQVVGTLDYTLFDDYIRINTRGTIRMSEAFIPNLKASTQKKLIVMSSDAASISIPDKRPGLYWYHASKVATNMVMRKFARDLKDQGIIVAMLHPGFVRTDKSVPKQKIINMAYMIDLEESVPDMMDVIARLTIADTDSFLRHTGEHVPW